jgi:hypothetical protein
MLPPWPRSRPGRGCGRLNVTQATSVGLLLLPARTGRSLDDPLRSFAAMPTRSTYLPGHAGNGRSSPKGTGREARRVIFDVFPRKWNAQAVRSPATVAIHCLGGAATGATGRGEDQRTILPPLNLIV